MSDEVMLMFRFYNDALNAACGTPGEWRASVLEVGIRRTLTIDLVDPQHTFLRACSWCWCLQACARCSSRSWSGATLTPGSTSSTRANMSRLKIRWGRRLFMKLGISDNVLGPVYATLNNRPWRTRWFHGRACLSKVLSLAINLLLTILRIIMCQTGFSLDFPDIFCCRSRNIHTPPQTPPYHGTLNGHSQHGHIMPKNGTMSMGGSMGGGPMGPGPNGMTLDQKPLPGPPTLHAGVG